ncbi:MAG: pseudaminic acid synthase [Betaproteobacteria bacterium]|nr:pseudaminic acid synthase [Betaproteobacteria bacterium]
MTATSVKIASREIGLSHPPFVIAEISGNHNGSLSRAMQIVESAAKAGAHALKLQTYTADTMTLDISTGDFHISDPGSPWSGRTLYDLYRDAATPWEWHQPIFDHCRELGMIGFSTPFDATAVDFLESLNVPCYKIASFENIDLPLIRKAASTGKPLIISTGMASAAEIDEAVQSARGAGCRDIVLLKCTSSYPADPSQSNLGTIPNLRETFQCEVGLSDHTLGIGAAVAAVALGATVIEKHVTLSRADGGVDAMFSLEPDELAALALECERAWRALGAVHYGPTDSEIPSLQFRRSLYVAQEMKAGDVFNTTNLRAVRPGRGLPPKYHEALLGRRVRRDVPRGTPVSWDLLE